MKMNAVEFQWLEYLLNHENMFETGVVELMNINYSSRLGGIIEITFPFSLT